MKQITEDTAGNDSNPNTKIDLESLARETGETFGRIAARFNDSTSYHLEEGREYIEKNPMKTLAIAAGVGLLAGSLFTLILRGRR